MKKSLLLSGALLIASAMYGFEPTVLPDYPFQGVSPNGRYTVANFMDMLLIITDLETNDQYVFQDTETGEGTFSQGYGKPVANDGSVVGNAVVVTMLDDTHYTTQDCAVVFKENDFTVLPVPRPEGINMAHSITPDGQYICGNVSNADWGLEASQVMMVPAVWTLQEDGTYAEPVVLPYPEKDILGKVPQYVTALVISDDGNTVAGLVTPGSGMGLYPIYYTRNAEGEWSYTIPHQELYLTNPDIVIPEEPTDMPKIADYISEEGMAEYNAQMDIYNETHDWADYPSYADYMTEEEIDAYNAAAEAYNAAFDAYYTAIAEATKGSIGFIFNNMAMTPDGRYIAGTAQGENGGFWMKPGNVNVKKSPFMTKRNEEGEEEGLASNTPYVFDLENDTYKAYKTEAGTQVVNGASDGYFVAFSGEAAGISEAYVMTPEGESLLFADYYAETAPEVDSWIKENMTHNVPVMDPETWDVDYKDVVVTGIPFCNSDMTTVVTYCMNTWDYDTNCYFFGYVFQGLPNSSTVGVEGIAGAGEAMLKALRGGMISLSEQAMVEVYSMDGKRVFNGNGQGILSTGLQKGVYLIRATFANGETQTVKAAF